MKQVLRDAWHLVKETISEWSDDNASTRAASLAYYTAFSIAPMVIIAVAVAGALFGEEAARGELHRQIQDLVGDSGARVIEDMVDSAAQPGRGTIATIIGVVVLMFAATGVFAELQSALNAFWKAKPRTTNGAVSFVRTRIISFAMVLCIGFLLLVSLVISAVLSAIGNWVSGFTDDWATLAQVINQGIAFGATTLLFAMIYKVLPDKKVAWGDVWLGAAVTSVLFTLGKFGIGLYLTKGSVASSYGAAGSFAALLIWVYYSSMILFLGAEFTQVYARRHGSMHHGDKPQPRKKEEHRRWPPHPEYLGTARNSSGH
ncbi:MAG: YihY/virulence factor BrkB family protein [Archangiaceae bacterium]|nr:YihY/virulence factor BrkB family protein [Archangiaceae bacterium]